MSQKLQQWYMRHKVLCWVMAGLVVLYTLAGFVVTPLIIHHTLKNKVSQALKRDVRAETVRTNPYTFSLRLRGLSIADRNGGNFIRVGDLYVNVDPFISLFKWGVAVKSVLLTNPQVRIVRGAAGQFNFSDLIPPSDNQPPKEDSPPSKPLRFVLNAFSLTDGEIQFEDQAQPVPFKTTLSALHATLSQLDTKPEAQSAVYELRARTEAAEGITVSGRIDVAPLSVAADFRLAGLTIAKYAPYYDAFLDGSISEGTLGFDARVDWADDTQIISDIQLNVSSLALTSSQGEALLSVPRFQVAGAVLDLKQQTMQMGRISTRDGEINIQMDQQGQLNLQRAFAPPPPQNTAAPETTPEPPLPDEPGWVVNVPEFALQNYTIRYRDQQTNPEAKFRITQVNLNAKDLSTRKDALGTADLALNWADQGNVKVKGEVGLIPVQANVNVEAEALDVRPAQPYINQFMQLVVTKGRFDTKGALKIVPRDGRMDVQYNGQAALNDFESVDREKADGFLNWKSLYITGLDMGTAPFRMTVNEVALTDFFNRLIINADGVSNLAMIMADQEDAKTEDKDSVRPSPAEKPPEAGTGQGPDIKISAVTLQGGKVDFRDLFVKPNVRLLMTQVGGRVSGLDAIKTHRADVLLKGRVGGNVPLEIKGRVNPLIEKPYVDLTIGLKGVDLSPFTPYSGKYLGYKLQKGQLFLDLNYRVAENKLDASNKVLLNQLTLGEAVPSPDATKLPIKLALALLKDRKGNINIDLPITGNFDDPEFSIGGIVVKMLVNLVVEIVSSPFKLLGALFGGGEELAYLDFDAGQSTISSEHTGKLDTLAKILYERPGLKLEIQGQVDPEADTDGLRQARFEEQLKAAKLKAMMAKGQKAVPLEQIELTLEERNRQVQRAYDAAEFPKPRDKKGKLKKLSFPEMEKLLYTAIAITNDDLRLLAHQRASAAKDYLLNQGKIEVQRLFIIEPKIEGADAEEQLQSRAKFNLT
ncbi:MAG: DUF748 domain-containing protein [Desulfobacteraceae bacterium]